MPSGVEEVEELSRVLVLVCTYNEFANLPKLVSEIRLALPDADLLVVDDGSPDGTGDWAAEEAKKDPQVRCLQRGGKLGLGSAIRDGLQYAIANNYSWMINLDADFSHDPKQLPNVLAANQKSQSAITIGSRYVPGGGMENCSWKRHLVSRCANRYARTLLGLKCRDCSSAYRCYRLSDVKRLPLEKMICTGYGFLEEILWWTYRFGCDIDEYPIIYTEREFGESKISMSEAVGTMQTIHRLLWRNWQIRGDKVG